jgi:hypothetical protein
MNSAHIIAAAIAWSAPSLPNETVARYATDIDNVIDESEVTLGLALVATAKWESSFRHEVETCECPRVDPVSRRRECDSDRHGKPTAFGIFQLKADRLGAYTPAQVCASNALSSERAAITMREKLARASGRWWKAFTFYVGAESESVVGRRKDFDWLRSNRTELAEKGEALCQGW